MSNTKTNAGYGKARSDTVVVKIIELRNDWKAKEPDTHKRDEALKKEDLSWNKFTAWCAPSNTRDGRTNMRLDMYLKYLKAAGLEAFEDKYWDTEANPSDYIVRHNKTPKKSKPSSRAAKSVKSVKSSNGEVKLVLNPTNLPDYPEVKKPASEPEVVLFEMPGKKSSATPTPTKSKGVSNPPKATATFTAPSVKKHAAPGSVRVVKAGECIKKPDKSNVSANYNMLMKKMNSFRLHLSVYLCALHIDANNVIHDTNVTNFIDIRNGKADIQLYDYIVLSDYFLSVFHTCTDKDIRHMFMELAELFNDIYISTLYYNDAAR